LEALKAFLAQLKYDRAAVRNEVEHPFILHPARLDARPGKPPKGILEAALVVPGPLRIHRACDTLLQWQPEIVEAPEYSMLETEPLAVPMEYKLLGYEPQQLQAFVGYLPPLHNQPLATGAPEEGIGLPLLSITEPEIPPSELAPSPKKGQAPTTAASTSTAILKDPALSSVGSIPPQLLTPPQTSIPLGSRYVPTNDAVAASRLPAYGFDPAYPLKPRTIPLPMTVAHEALASNTIRAMHGLPMLAETWQRRRAGGGCCADVMHEEPPEEMAGPAPEDAFTQTWVRSAHKDFLNARMTGCS
jgi:hypothetical protein